MYMPIMVFIDRKGLIQYEHLGDDVFMRIRERTRAHIEQLLGSGRNESPAGREQE
jgi:hypothetical protein